MKVKFNDIVKIARSSCERCLAFKYELPCGIDDNIVKFLGSFGEPIYDLNLFTLLKMKSKDEYLIEGRLTATIIKFGIPKKLINTNLDKNSRKKDFESSLANWLSDKFNVSVTRD